MFNKSIIVLAAGAGTRMKSDTPKVLHKISGKPMLYYSIKASRSLFSFILRPSSTICISGE